jgi:hypothetical protein
MANPTLFQLATTTVGSGGVSSVTFSAIPQVYTDLVVKISARGAYAGIGDDINVTFNGLGTNRTGIILYGSGSAAASASVTATGGVYPGSTTTANTFGNAEIYIPNYTSANYKSLSGDSVGENNATASYQELTASLWSSTAAITSITFSAAGNWLQYSTFTLYGVRNY